MKLKDIVCDFEYAERLQELGIDRKTLFKYGRGNSDDWSVIGCFDHCWQWLRAFSVAELGEMLPSIIKIDELGSYITHGYRSQTGCYVLYMQHVCDPLDVYDDKFFQDPKEANARAKLLIWLIENNHIRVKDLNK